VFYIHNYILCIVSPSYYYVCGSVLMIVNINVYSNNLSIQNSVCKANYCNLSWNPVVSMLRTNISHLIIYQNTYIQTASNSYENFNIGIKESKPPCKRPVINTLIKKTDELLNYDETVVIYPTPVPFFAP